MVYAFIIHSLSTTDEKGGSIEWNKAIYFYYFFQNQNKDLISQKKELQKVIQTVQLEVSFRNVAEESIWKFPDLNSPSTSSLSSSSPSVSNTNVSSNNNQNNQKTTDIGLFNISFDPEEQKKFLVVWKRVNNTSYTMICEEEENAVLAANFLSLFIKVLNEHFKFTPATSNTKEMMMKPEEVLVLLQNYLPSGQLLFINSSFARFLKKEVEFVLMSK
eukprot:TRINITY_DN8406_c0_g4_i1.p1 TRINITY_DN8406_c0_g4~~TRINITY_DN8406_c0_g4_i1.p1  ORF type:complete len:217 (-),score=69.69 TRINITY_DN8406_c0_g4_i1:4-654(-)